jgi:hypothetical protein
MGIISQIWNGGDDIGEREKRGGEGAGTSYDGCFDIMSRSGESSGRSIREKQKEKLEGEKLQ